MMSSGYIELTKILPALGEYEVVVCGGGPSGCAAALSARRAGCSVLLVESQGQLGGVGTSGGVTIWLGYRSMDGRKWVGGIFEEIVHRLILRGGAVDPFELTKQKYQPFGWYPSEALGIPFEPSAAARLLDELMTEAGVNVRLFTSFVDTVLENQRITHVIIHNKAGLPVVPCKVVVDATGDADVAARSGCDVVKGRDKDGLMAPATLIFCVDRVDREALSNYIHEHNSPRFREMIQLLREQGLWPFLYDIFISIQVLEDDVFMINTSRLCGVDGTDPESLSQGMMRGRQEIEQLFSIMRKHFPGFARARMRWVAPMIGIRETRRIVSDGILTVSDLISGKEFPDTIGFSAYGWDLPDPQRPSYQPMHENRIHCRNPYTPIPYRIMLPRPVTNLICPGRAVSVERDVLGPLRVMAPVMAMGEAAGLAAAQVVRSDIPFRQVDVPVLRQALRAQRAIVDVEAA